MGAFLLHIPWVQLYLLYVGALVVINLLCATTRQPRSAGKTSPGRCENQDGGRMKEWSPSISVFAGERAHSEGENHSARGRGLGTER